MKLAYLISSHVDPIHLNRMIKALDMGESTDFYIHIDAKSDISLFGNVSNGIIGHVNVLNRRVYTQWGGYSQCLYQQYLINACIESGIEYDRVVFMSGLDYPLWSSSKILQFFTENPTTEFISGRNVSYDSQQCRKFVIYHYFRDLKINRKLKRWIAGSSQILMRILPIRRNPYIFTNGKKNEIYYGSSWWGLTGNCLKYVYKEINENKDWSEYFKTCYTPDELMIQTIIFNSSYSVYANEYKGEDKGLEILTPLHYIEYRDSIKVYDECDYDTLIKSNKMFARKLVTGKSDLLMDMLDNYRK